MKSLRFGHVFPALGSKFAFERVQGTQSSRSQPDHFKLHFGSPMPYSTDDILSF